MSLIHLPPQQLRNKDLALLQTGMNDSLTAEELSLLKTERNPSNTKTGFLVAIGACALLMAGIEISHRSCLRLASFAVDGMCCDFTAKTAVQRLTRLPGVVGVKPHYASKRLEVTFLCHSPIAPKEVWDAVDQSDVRPVELALQGKNYRDRPAF